VRLRSAFSAQVANFRVYLNRSKECASSCGTANLAALSRPRRKL